MITIVDSGGANLASILFALERLKVPATVSQDAQVIKNASHVIIPGVGSAHQVMKRLAALQLNEVLRLLTQPVLGICVGMQVLFEHSEEGDVDCLNIIPGAIKKLSSELVLPHMGWNTIEQIKESPLLKHIPNEAYVYFVHSFAVPILGCTCAMTSYGARLSALVQQNNFFGTQFHPERSGAIGHQLLKNFLEL